MDPVRQQVMISQFVFVAGCRPEHARQLLAEHNWQFEVFWRSSFRISFVVVYVGFLNEPWPIFSQAFHAVSKVLFSERCLPRILLFMCPQCFGILQHWFVMLASIFSLFRSKMSLFLLCNFCANRVCYTAYQNVNVVVNISYYNQIQPVSVHGCDNYRLSHFVKVDTLCDTVCYYLKCLK